MSSQSSGPGRHELVDRAAQDELRAGVEGEVRTGGNLGAARDGAPQALQLQLQAQAHLMGLADPLVRAAARLDLEPGQGLVAHDAQGVHPPIGWKTAASGAGSSMICAIRSRRLRKDAE